MIVLEMHLKETWTKKRLLIGKFGGNLRPHRTVISLPPSYFFPFAIDWNTIKMWTWYAQLSPYPQHARTLPATAAALKRAVISYM